MSIYEQIKEKVADTDVISKEMLQIIVNGSNENTNKDSDILSTQRDLMAGILSKEFAVKYMLPEHIVKAHKDGVIHIHDLDYYSNQMVNCCLLNLKDMLQNGTKISDKLIEKPKGLRTAATITTQIIAQVASGQFGK